jgi:hypothetical protein
MKRVILVTAVACSLMVAAQGASSAPPAATVCTGYLFDTTVTVDLIAGPGCALEYVTVTGDVTIVEGGSFYAFGSDVGGSIKGRGAASVVIGFYDMVGGNVQIEDSGSVSVARTQVGGKLELRGNQGAGLSVVGVAGNARLSGNTASGIGVVYAFVDGNLTIDHNTSSLTNGNRVSVSEIGGILNCHQNDPAVGRDGITTAKKFIGECAEAAP